MNFVWAIALLIASYAISALTAKKPAGAADAKPATFSEFQFPQATEGTPQAVIFGDCWSPDWAVLGVANYRVDPIRSEDTEAGASGGGGKK